jgi:hypothetical protein
MIAAAGILSASLVLDNEPGFTFAVTRFIANTSDGSRGAGGNAWIASHGLQTGRRMFHFQPGCWRRNFFAKNERK